MTDLSILLGSEERPTIVADISKLVDDAVNSQSGITGVAVKGALSAARKAKADAVPTAVDKLLPDILGDLQLHWEAYEQTGQGDFGSFLEPRSEEVAEALLGTADRAVEQAGVGAVEKIYGSLRGRGTKLIAPEVPALGRIVENHMR